MYLITFLIKFRKNYLITRVLIDWVEYSHYPREYTKHLQKNITVVILMWVDSCQFFSTVEYV